MLLFFSRLCGLRLSPRLRPRGAPCLAFPGIDGFRLDVCGQARQDGVLKTAFALNDPGQGGFGDLRVIPAGSGDFQLKGLAVALEGEDGIAASLRPVRGLIERFLARLLAAIELGAKEKSANLAMAITRVRKFRLRKFRFRKFRFRVQVRSAAAARKLGQKRVELGPPIQPGPCGTRP